MAEKINLDSLINREDLAIEEKETRSSTIGTVSARDLEFESFFRLNIFKPDFQRETVEWDYKKISNFINSFLNRELIPAIILWENSGGKVFVIDGAHRLSSLIAWINDDYGDGDITRKTFKNNVPDDQMILADKTRQFINNQIGSYQDIKNSLLSPNKSNEKYAEKARMLSSTAIQLQWVVGDVDSAERSFFNINQQGVPLNKTELELIKKRKAPNCIAARAIMRKGEGHRYWEKFNEEIQKEIVTLSKDIFDLMYNPKLVTPIKTTDLPNCGKYTGAALQMIYETVNLLNPVNNKKEDDQTGSDTVRSLKIVRKYLRLLSSNHESSLGLHPLIYFYADNGSYRPSNFYSFLLFTKLLDDRNKKNLFTRNRQKFEEMMPIIQESINHLTRKYRSALNAKNHLVELYMIIIDELDKGTDINLVITNIKKNTTEDKFKDLPEFQLEKYISYSKDFDSKTKSEVFILESKDKINCCGICGGKISGNTISIDHKERKEDGGLGIASNGQLTHPYCNTGYKN